MLSCALCIFFWEELLWLLQRGPGNYPPLPQLICPHTYTLAFSQWALKKCLFIPQGEGTDGARGGVSPNPEWHLTAATGSLKTAIAPLERPWLWDSYNTRSLSPVTGFLLLQSQKERGPHEDLANFPSFHKEKANRADLLKGFYEWIHLLCFKMPMTSSNPEETAVLLEKCPAWWIFQKNKESPICVG